MVDGKLHTTLAALLACFLIFVAGCGHDESSSEGGGGTPGAAAGPPKNVESIRLLFAYGSEKESWVKQVTDEFNRAQHKTKAGKVIWVDGKAMGSGECIDELLAETTKADLVSPASSAFIKLGNAQSRSKTNADLVGPTDNLVLSPVVIAMWKPMAEALGYPQKALGWADVLALAKDPKGWETHGHGEWGRFKFGHTHPEYSNSGLIAALAEVYAGAGKTHALTLEDVQAPRTAQFVAGIEQAVVHYGSSTGFFGKKMFAGGPSYLSAAVLYENMVIESYSLPNRDPAFPVVAIYPREGTFWSDHPVGIVQRPWVTPERQQAARVYIDYLLDTPQQQKSLAFGFRPANPKVALAEPIDLAHGVNPQEPQNVLEVPEPNVMNAIIGLWHANKKHANVVLVFDTSGSMNDDQKIIHARQGAAALISLLDDEDTLSLLPFSSESHWAGQNLRMKDQRATAQASVSTLTASGGTKLFDTINQAYAYLQANPDPTRISAVVVLTDGADTESTLKLPELIRRIKADSEKKNIRVFTIGYGQDAMASELQQVADQTQARYFGGKPENIRAVFKEIATFF